jgi:hypothetical protein
MVYIMHSTSTQTSNSATCTCAQQCLKNYCFPLSMIQSFFYLSESSSTKILDSMYYSLQTSQQTNMKNDDSDCGPICFYCCVTLCVTARE